MAEGLHARCRQWHFLLVAQCLLLALACGRRVPLTSRQMAPTHPSPSAVTAPVRTNQPEVQGAEAVCSGPPAPVADSLNSAPTSPHANPTISPSPLDETHRRDPSDAPFSRRPCHLLAVGDSLTDPQSGGGGYLEAAKRDCGCQVTNIARGGAMVNQIRAHFLTYLADSNASYSHVIVFGGVNDLYSDLTAKRTVHKITADLETVYRVAKRRGSKVIAISVTPWGGFRRYFTEHRWENTLELNRWIRESRSRGLTDAVLDGEHLLTCGNAERLCEQFASPYRDGLHFGPLGHRQLAQALVRALGRAHCQTTPDDGPDEGTSGS